MSNVLFEQPGIWSAFCLSAERHADLPAVQHGGIVWTYADLRRDADQVRTWLGRHPSLRPVLIMPGNTPWAVAAILGAIAAGSVPILADPTWTAAELKGVARRCAIRALLTEPSGAEPPPFAVPQSECGGYVLSTIQVEEPDAVFPRSTTAFGRFTSGTTGAPRCLEFTERAALSAAKAWWGAARVVEADRVLCLATINNGLAFNTSLLTVLLSGALLVFHRGPVIPSALARTFAQAKPTILVGFPFVLDCLTSGSRRDLDVRALRLSVSSTAPLKPKTAALWREMTGVPVCNYYGLVEAGPCTFNDDTVPGSVGQPLDGVRFRVTSPEGRDLPLGEEGQLRVFSSAMASGFLDHSGPHFAQSCDCDGYFLTQDLAALGHKGDLFLKGRLGSLMNIEGRKIDPGEVLQVLRSINGVADAAVLPETSGDRLVIAAYIESASVTVASVVEQCAKQLAPYKRPQRITIVSSLPRSATGKLMLSRLQQGRDLKEVSI